MSEEELAALRRIVYTTLASEGRAPSLDELARRAKICRRRVCCVGWAAPRVRRLIG
jgi:ferric iron reductase protein FhuF